MIINIASIFHLLRRQLSNSECPFNKKDSDKRTKLTQEFRRINLFSLLKSRES